MNLVKAIGLGTLGVLALGLGSWKIFGQGGGQSRKPTKQQTLSILQTIRQEFYPILIKIADIVSKQLAPRGLTPQQNEKIVLMDPTIKLQIQKINEKIYSNFTEQEIRQATEKQFKDDGDIMKQKKEFTQQFKKSLLGVQPDPNIIISKKIHKKKLLEVVSEILEDKIARCQTQNLKQASQNEVLSFLQKDVEEDERVTKQKIKQKLSLCAKDAIKIFHFVVVEYKKSDESFRESYLQIIKKYNQKIKQVTQKNN